MSDAILLDQAAQNLRGVLARLSLGEALTLADEAGRPVALLVSLQTEAPDQISVPTQQTQTPQGQTPPSQTWLAQWQEMARAIGTDWPVGQSAADVLAEMRR